MRQFLQNARKRVTFNEFPNEKARRVALLQVIDGGDVQMIKRGSRETKLNVMSP